MATSQDSSQAFYGLRTTSISKQTRRGITNDERKAIREYVNGFDSRIRPSQRQIATWFTKQFNHKISQSTVSDSLSDRHKHLDGPITAPTGFNLAGNAQRQREGSQPLIEKILFEWALTINHSGGNITGDILRSKAQQIYTRLRPEDAAPTFGKGWLQGFRHRYSMKRRIKHGEAGDVNLVDLETKLVPLRLQVSDYPPSRVYNVDETGIFWKSTPDATIAYESLSGGKVDKTRFTAVLVCNADGTDKPPIWYIGTAESPQAFKGINVHNLGEKGLVYRANKKAWMNGSIFREWLLWFDLRMKSLHNDKVLLLIDGFSAHEAAIQGLRDARKDLECLEILFLPPNTTSKCQPLDQGIIRTWKAYYRRFWLSFIIEQLDQGENPFASIHLLQAFRWCQESWEQCVTTATIENCWLKARILAPEARPMTERRHRKWEKALQDNNTSEPDVYAELIKYMKSLEEKRVIKKALTIEQLLNPEHEKVQNSVDDEELLDSIIDANQEADNEDEDNEVIETPPVDVGKALNAVKTLREWVLQQPEEEGEFMQGLNALASRLQKARLDGLSQVTLDRYFS